MATVKAVLNKDREKKQGGYSLVIQILHKRAKRVIYSGYVLKNDEFDMLHQRAVYIKNGRLTMREVKDINYYIECKKRELKTILEVIQARTKNYTIDDIVSKYHQDQSNKYLLTYAEYIIRQKEQLGKLGTAKAYRSTLHSLEKFVGTREIIFNEIDHTLVLQYENYLYSTGVKQNTVAFYLRNFRAIYNSAYNNGVEMCHCDAFLRIHIKNEKTTKRALKKEIIEKLANLTIDKRNIDEARDIFMFSFFTRGMSFVDVVNLKYSNIVGGVINYRRQKTNQPIRVAVTEPLQKIIDKYNGRDSNYVLPFINESHGTTLYAKYRAAYDMLYHNLKILQEVLSLETPLTFHVARHSWATIAKDEGASVTQICEGLGHACERTTAIYLKEFDNSVIDQINERIVDFAVSQVANSKKNTLPL